MTEHYQSETEPLDPSFNKYNQENDNRLVLILTQAVPALAMWLSLGLLGILASIFIYAFFKNDKDSLIRHSAAQALNIQITSFIWVILSYILMLIFIGFIMLPLVGLVTIAYHIIFLLKVIDGEKWSPPFVIQVVK